MKKLDGVDITFDSEELRAAARYSLTSAIQLLDGHNDYNFVPTTTSGTISLYGETPQAFGILNVTALTRLDLTLIVEIMPENEGNNPYAYYVTVLMDGSEPIVQSVFAGARDAVLEFNSSTMGFEPNKLDE